MGASDGDLVRAVLGGDRAAYAALYDRYAPMVRAICNDHTADLAEAQDLSQDVFLKVFGKLGHLREPDRFAVWLVGITRNECRDWLRRRSRHRRLFADSIPDVPAPASNDADDNSEAVLEAMRLLPERERLAVHAFYLRGESADAVRTLLGLSVSGTYRLIERAREQLAKLLSEIRENVP